MQPINRLAKRILHDFPYTFAASDTFYWSPSQATVYYTELGTAEDIYSLLHEIAHAELGHTDFTADIHLLHQEVQAWEHAKTILAPRYNVALDETYLYDHLETYRLWLHDRSTCPDCGQNGIQTQNTYSCINCRCLWRVNDARVCGLRRTKIIQ